MTERVIVFEGTRATAAAKALGSKTRAAILELTGSAPYSVSQLSAELGIAQPAITKHVSELERAGLLSVHSGLGERGTTRMCSRNYDEVRIKLPALPEDDKEIERSELSMPIGGFSRSEAHPTCGIASVDSMIGFTDDPRSFYLPERTSAGILWFGYGFVEYEFPNPLLRDRVPDQLSLSMEICSEAPGYAIDYPSDITFSINGRELGVWTCPGDMGGEPGALNPAWWNHGTQFGFLKTLTVRGDGAFIDGVRVSDLTPCEVIDHSRPSIIVRLEVKPDAAHRGGLTIFGRHFGNYPQDMVLTLAARRA